VTLDIAVNFNKCNAVDATAIVGLQLWRLWGFQNP